MRVSRDFACWDCEVEMEDILEQGERPLCPECNKPMELYFKRMNFNSYFKGSYKAEYGEQGKIFNGFTKEDALRTVTKKKRIADGRKKKGHCDIRDVKEEKK